MYTAAIHAAAGRKVVEVFQERGALSEPAALSLDELGLVREGTVERLLSMGILREAGEDLCWFDQGAALDYQDAQRGKMIIAVVMLILLFGGTWATYKVLTTMT